ncbi:uncharacterized protein BDV14DRAFT_200853 [Aspergillus stella-maris]|uniref:uncharacterized protein n=1 Tax=Aspergillus stella-maris TaxID=1810926 RepID=UPI003CCCB083
MPYIYPTEDPDQELTPGARIAAQVACILDAVRVWNMLWGWVAVSLLGVDEGIPDIEFLVPDEQVIQAKDALINAGHRLCQDLNCPELSVDRAREVFRNTGHVLPSRSQYHIVPDYHFHHGPSATISLLYRLEAGDPGVMLSTDGDELPPADEMGSTGPWLDIYPVRLLIPDTFLKALGHLVKEDEGDENGESILLLWKFMIHSLCVVRGLRIEEKALISMIWTMLNGFEVPWITL